MSRLVDEIESSGHLDDAHRFELRAGLAALAERLVPEQNASQPRIA
jgi:hypothetical protein